MKSPTLGKSISVVEVTNFSPNGIWLYVTEKEYFLPYDQYPWFERATVKQIFDVQLLHGFHLYWPQLDVDLELKCLDTPHAYPLKWKIEPGDGLNLH